MAPRPFPPPVRGAVLGAALVLGGCGSAGVAELPAAAGPARSPATTVAPQGRVVALPGTIVGLAWDAEGRRLIATVDDPPRLLVLSRRGRLLRSVGLPGPPGRPAVPLGASAVGGESTGTARASGEEAGFALVPIGAPGLLLRVRLRDGRVLARLGLPGVPAVAVSTGGSGAAVLDAAGGRVSLIDDDRVVARASVPADPGVRAPDLPGDLLAASDGALLGVLDGRARTLTRFAATTTGLSRRGALAVGAGPTRVATAADYAFVVDEEQDAVLVVRIRKGFQLERRVALAGGPYAIAFDTRRRRLWVTLTGRDEVAELPGTRRPRILRMLPSVRQPDAIAVDPASGRVFVAGARSLQLLDPPGTTG